MYRHLSMNARVAVKSMIDHHRRLLRSAARRAARRGRCRGAGRAFKALADPVRLRLLSLIAAAPEGTACSCDLEEPVGKSQPTVSHHLSVLADAGLITKEKVGRWVNCTVVPERLAALRDVLGDLTPDLVGSWVSAVCLLVA